MRKGPSFHIIQMCDGCSYLIKHELNKETNTSRTCSKLNKPIYLDSYVDSMDKRWFPPDACPYKKEQYKQHLMFELGLDLKTTLNLLGYKNVEIKEKTLTVVIANILESELDMLKTLISGYKFSAIEPVDSKLCIRFVKKDWP